MEGLSRGDSLSFCENQKTESQTSAVGIHSGGASFLERGIKSMYIYPENLKAKPMLWLWLLRDIAVLGAAAILSILALVQGIGMAPLVATVLYAFLSIQVDGSSILDFLRRAACFLFLRQQRYEWRLDP